MNTAPDKTKMLTRPATSARLRQIAMQLRWRPLVYRRALQLVGVPPDAERWRQLAERFLLLFASLMICTGIAALFAYNWAELDRFVKFGAIEIGILGCVALAWYRGLDALSGQSALFGASALVGLLLAVYGQTYQTGADPYGLFLSWALLILGWAIIGRQPGIWMLMVILANLSLILYWEQVLYPQENFAAGLATVLGPLVRLTEAFSDFRLAQLVFVLNAAILILWEWFAGSVIWMQGRWFPRLVAILALSAIVATTLILIFGGLVSLSRWLHSMAPVWFAVFVLGCLWYYRRRRYDLFMLSICLLAIVLVVTSAVARLLGDGFEVALILALLVIGQTAASAYWLRAVARSWRTTA
ncbi:MAG TPA: DUF2157 domain-containing protein [Chromatiaceae bacterium]|jgi:uncharacterized membrane protein|nr:MAG: hypothetical protein N838_27620 [Thiohalocapsa sp. PB-PSB1]QQO53807.1 MAG: DUF2157 domain-containing protein [Thiohalocapsa sp. PB-PSB1]HBG93799.1 DUF2157 domain-containing protein [Chromatiaceae bacterium]HCS88853.1 DUF2157 domain-containing protein [Chromatiaceae bacterium]